MDSGAAIPTNRRTSQPTVPPQHKQGLSTKSPSSPPKPSSASVPPRLPKLGARVSRSDVAAVAPRSCPGVGAFRGGGEASDASLAGVLAPAARSCSELDACMTARRDADSARAAGPMVTTAPAVCCDVRQWRRCCGVAPPLVPRLRRLAVPPVETSGRPGMFSTRGSTKGRRHHHVEQGLHKKICHMHSSHYWVSVLVCFHARPDPTRGRKQG